MTIEKAIRILDYKTYLEAIVEIEYYGGFSGEQAKGLEVTCKHFRLESWNHYGMKMPECGCKLSKDMWACKYLDRKFCPNYEKKEIEE